MFLFYKEYVFHSSGVSLRTVTRIISEKREADATSTKMGSQMKFRKARKDKILLDLDFLQKKIREYYSKNETPTVQKLFQELKEETGFKGSREIVRQHIKKIGYSTKVNTIGKPPSSNSTKAEIVQWLTSQSVEFCPQSSKEELLDISYKNLPEPVPTELF